ncbi:hypothetical protein HO133_005537 [Letharia lupina]|uniref:ATP-dependent DNA ligase family profile domain-containing protein n=1 Tax=Letharia lupina TaxID=560253 RepID=A0A8H6C940_9LECA|nr:uncharacterized protein HO133_005537 [Letharia lupina]KAF6218993.1 hypothetical protein HO133_005537 [Letharia lupina]
MPLLFLQLCNLLSDLEKVSHRDPPLLPAHRQQRYRENIEQWFTTHRVSINSPDIDLVVLLSALFPEKRTDRVYNIKLKSLTNLLKRCLGLGKDRLEMLDQWRKPGRGSLCDCVERALRQAEFPEQPANQITLEQVDEALATIAGKCRFSGPKVKGPKDSFLEVEDGRQVLKILGQTYKRMQSREAKWFTRMILKDYSCLDLSESMVYHHLDVRLPTAMQMYDNFEAAISELRGLPASQMAGSNQGALIQRRANDARLLQPRIGVKLGPPKWVKAKGGVKHAVSVVDGRTMSIEKKHDGEYCQIHIDMSKGEECIQIFSKSCKDSTSDRRGVHRAIKDSLRIGRHDCGFSRKCILEGELLVWSDKTKGILEYHKLRKHVSRSGSFLGTELDSQPHPWEHLMIMYYDVMLVDDDPVVHRPHKKRRQLLEGLVSLIEGRADIVWQKHVRFDRPTGPEKLKKALAMAFVLRWEGLILKPSDEPYFNLGTRGQGRFSNRWVKLKKDCIQGLGDTADFAVVGAGYDVNEAEKYEGMNIRWTHFYIGCLRNKAAVLHAGEKPQFFVFDQIKDCIKREDMKTLTENGYLRAMDTEFPETWEVFDIELARGLPLMSVVFRQPFVFDVAGSGFDKSPNRDVFTLRFPRVMKIRLDRDWRETVDLDELQHMATEARTVPTGDLSDNIAGWIEKLNNVDRGARGRMTSWDFTDDEEDGHYLLIPGAESSTPKATRRPRAAAVPPLIRMDTGEMRDQERRLSDGAVVEQPKSKHSMGSITNDGTLQTPPNSSPRSRSGGVTSSNRKTTGFSENLRGPSRKRSAERDDKEDSIRKAKKTRPFPIQHSKSEPKPTNNTRLPTLKKPLREITNLSRPPLSARSTDTLEPKPRSTTHFSLVRKTAVDTDRHFHRRRNTSKVYVEPSSPARETTASESTSAETTQQTISEESRPAPLLPPDRATIEIGSLQTPPSTAEPASSMQIPHIPECDVMLGPCLVDQNHKVHELLFNHYKSALPFPRSRPAECSTPSFKSKPRCELVVLVESNDTHAVGRHVGALLHHLLLWHPRVVTLWDWRFLEFKSPQPMEKCHRTALIHKYFVAKMWWDPLAKDQGAVVLKWCGGKSRLVLKAELDEMEWIEGI